jgi:hypothetical protein
MRAMVVEVGPEIEQLVFEVCLARIRSTFEITKIQRGRVTRAPAETMMGRRRIYWCDLMVGLGGADLNHRPRPYQGPLRCYMHSIFFVRRDDPL